MRRQFQFQPNSAVPEWLNAIFGWAIFLGVVFGPLTLILVISLLLTGSGGSLSESCKPDTLQAWVLAVVAPKRFWTEQLDYLEKQAAFPFTPPSKAIIEGVNQAEAAVAGVSSSISMAPSQAEAYALRERASQIEFEEYLRRIDADALTVALAKRQKALVCIDRVREKLQPEATY